MPAPDRLAVWTYEEAGEEIPHGDPSVTDWQGQADEVWLGGGVQPRLWPVAGTGDLWEASLRIRRLEEAVITILAMPRLAGDAPLPSVPGHDNLWWEQQVPVALGWLLALS